MDINSKIYIAGHNGMVGSAIKRNLEKRGYRNIVCRTSKELNLIDDVINEPLIGAHRQKELAILALKEYFLNSLDELKRLTPSQRYEKKYQKIMNLGSFLER